MRRPYPFRSLLSVALALLGPLFFTTCGGDGGGTGPIDPSVSLSPATASLYVGDQVSLTATVTGTSSSASFSSSAPGVATVDASGTVTGISPGSATITASAGGASATAQITVDPSSIAVGPASSSILPDETVQLSATITGGSGHAVTWISDDQDVATVDGNGLVTAVGPGSATITASVDGQSGVEASATIEVLVPAPEVEFVSFEDEEGGALDFEDAEIIFTITAEVTGYVGVQANIEILFDDEVFMTVPVTVEAEAAPTENLGDAGLAPRRTQQVQIPVSIIEVEDLAELGVDFRLNNGPHSLTGVVEYNGDRSGIHIRGSGNSVNIITNNPLVGVVRTTPVGQTLTVDDVLFTAQCVDYQVAIASPKILTVSRIELVVGHQAFGSFDPPSVMYQGDMVDGVVNFRAARSDREGFEGGMFTQEIKAFDAGGGFEDVLIANNYPDLFGYLGLKEYSYVDYAPPSFSATPVANGDLVFGASTDIQSYLDLVTGFGTSSVSDATGLTRSLWQLRLPPDDWDPNQSHQLGSDLLPTDGFTLIPGFFAEDGFGQGSRGLVRDGSGIINHIAVDITPPTQVLAPGDWNIADMGYLSTSGPWTIQVNTNDPPYPGFTWSSGINPTGFDFRLRYKNGPTDDYLFGDAGDLEPIPHDLTLGWALPLGPVGGEYLADVETHDLAGNGSGISSFNWVYDPTVPVLGPMTFSGLTDNVFAAGTDIGVHFNATEDVEIWLATASAYNPTGQLYYFDELYLRGTRFDDQYEIGGDQNLMIRDFVPRIEFTGGPHQGNGWYEFNWAGGGAVNTAGGYASTFVDITSQLPPAGVTFANGQLQSWFPDQSLIELCLLAGPQCNGRPTSSTVSARGWVPSAQGMPQHQEGMLLAMKRGPLGEEMWRPLGDPVPVVLEPFGTFGYEVQLSMLIEIELHRLNEHFEALAWGVKNPAGDLFVTENITLDIKPNW